MRITDEQIAARAAARKNRKLKEECPLFWEHFATTADQELQRVKRQHAEAEQHAQRMRERSREAYARGIEYREVARALLSEEAYARAERIWLRRFPDPDPDRQGWDLADHWWGALKGTEYARERCPNAHMHKKGWPPQYNHLLQRFVPVTRCPTCGCNLASENSDHDKQAD